MGLLQEQDADSKPKNNDTSAKQIRKQVREFFENGSLESFHAFGWVGEYTAKESADDCTTVVVSRNIRKYLLTRDTKQTA
jgi:hypothetical protein